MGLSTSSTHDFVIKTIKRRPWLLMVSEEMLLFNAKCLNKTTSSGAACIYVYQNIFSGGVSAHENVTDMKGITSRATPSSGLSLAICCCLPLTETNFAYSKPANSRFCRMVAVVMGGIVEGWGVAVNVLDCGQREEWRVAPLTHPTPLGWNESICLVMMGCPEWCPGTLTGSKRKENKVADFSSNVPAPCPGNEKTSKPLVCSRRLRAKLVGLDPIVKPQKLFRVLSESTPIKKRL